MKNYLKNWNPVRILRLAVGIFIGVQGILSYDWPMTALGALFSLMPLFNIGCCGASGCRCPTPNTASIRRILCMKKFVKKHGLTLLGGLVGSVAGYGYWRFVGCSSGGCAITSNPVNSSLYGALLGGLLFSIFQKNKRETT